MFQFPIKSDWGGVRMLRIPNFVNNYTIGCANSTKIILLGVLIYKMICCWVPYFYTQGFTFIIAETACILMLALKINYNLGSTF